MDNDKVKAPNFKLLLNGSDLPDDLLSAVAGVSLEDEINLPAMFTIRFNIVDFEKGTWRGIDLKTFNPGDEVKVFMGMDKTVEMMVGEITTLDLTFGEFSFMEIRGYDKLHRLRFGTKRRSFKDMKDSEIASNIVSEINLTPKVEDTGTVHPYIFQNNQSNYEFLLIRAKRINYEMMMDDKTFIFRPSQEGQAPAIILQYGIGQEKTPGLQEFSIQLKILTGGSEVEIRGWDIQNKTEITSKASSGNETSNMAGKETGYEISKKGFGESTVSVLDEAVIDSIDADTLAQARYNTILREFITGEGKCGGNPDIRAGKAIEIKGIGDRFSGTYYVVSTVHSINDEGYKTTFKVRRTGA